jgi:ketosteroid isomerase-like protein
MRKYWICAVLLSFILGIAVEKVLQSRWPAPTALLEQDAALAGIEKLHQLDRRVTLLNDPKALQQLWTNDAVRLAPDSPADVGKPAIYAKDVRTWADTPDFAVVSYKSDIRDVRVVNDWAFEWGLFDAGFRPSSSKPVVSVHGKAVRILHRESSGDWKFSRIMVALNSGQSTDEAPRH